MSSLGMTYIQEFITKLKPGTPRTFHNEYSQATNLLIDMLNQFLVVGLDIAIMNRGAAALTMQIDGKTIITVNAGSAFNLTNTVFTSIAIVSAVQFELVVAGVHVR